MTDPQKLHAAKVAAAEDAAIATIPRELLDNLERAQKKFAADGGCPGCGSKILAVHRIPCSECDKHPFD